MNSPKAKAFDPRISRFAFRISRFAFRISRFAFRASREEEPDQERFARCAAEFISLMSVKETDPKKTLCAKGKSGQSASRGFFERASCPRRKTPHIRVRRPAGLQNPAGCRDL